MTQHHIWCTYQYFFFLMLTAGGIAPLSEALWVLMGRSSNWTTPLMCHGLLKPGRYQECSDGSIFQVWSKNAEIFIVNSVFLILVERFWPGSASIYCRSYCECLMDTEETASGSLIFEEIWQDAVQKSLSGPGRFWKDERWNGRNFFFAQKKHWRSSQTCKACSGSDDNLCIRKSPSGILDEAFKTSDSLNDEKVLYSRLKIAPPTVWKSQLLHGNITFDISRGSCMEAAALWSWRMDHQVVWICLDRVGGLD